MRDTSRETRAARALADAFVEFMLARDEAAAAREQARPREEVRVHVDAPKPAQDAPQRPVQHVEPKLPDRLLVDAKEAAELLSVGSRTLWTMTAPRGPLPSVRLGRAVRYSVSSLAEFIRKSETKRR